MNNKIIEALIELGSFIKQLNSNTPNKNLYKLNKKYYNRLFEIVSNTKQHNGWFEEIMVKKALLSIATLLEKKQLKKWISNYDDSTLFNRKESKNVGLIMAGNIPAVGFHDLLCILLTGHKAQIKCSSNDNIIIPFLVTVLTEINPIIGSQVSFKEQLKGFDAAIATGNNNSSRYFHQYFKKYPHIIRKNRHSIAIIDENTSKDELSKLGEDLFSYFGLGCRNVSTIFLQKDCYTIASVIESIKGYQEQLLANNKYTNNYNYYKALFLLEKESFLDSGFSLLKESSSLYSPTGIIHYSWFEGYQELKDFTNKKEQELQCIVGNSAIQYNLEKETINYGESQLPKPWDYADKIDTIKFLTTL